MTTESELLQENEKLLKGIKTRQTKLNKLSAYLSELESQLALLFAASPDIIVFLNEDEKIIKISDAAFAILGYKKEEMLNRYIWDFISSKDVEETKNSFAKLKEKKLMYYDTRESFVNHWLDKNGKEVKLVWRFSVCDEREKQTIGVATDITHFGGNNIYNAKLLQTVIDSSTDGIVILDAQTNNSFVYVNGAYENITGYTSDELLGKRYEYTLTEKSINSKAYKTFIDCMANGKGCDVLLECKNKNGNIFYNRLAIASVIEHNVVVNFIGISRDITDKIGVKYEWSTKAENGFVHLNKTL